MLLFAIAVSGLQIRPAVLSNKADAEALCAVRSPTTYVVEQGSTGFMGQKVELSQEEAFERRVSARLGSAIRDGATVLIATDPAEERQSVIGTVDCVEFKVGSGRRPFEQKLPRRFLVRNLWVAEERRRQGIARQLMAESETFALSHGVSTLVLEVLVDNVPALALYEDLGFEELDPPPMPIPRWMRGALLMGKTLGTAGGS